MSLEILRGLSMGKDVMATRIQEEVRELVKVLAQHEGRAVDVAKLLSISSSNNINFLVFGKRFEYDDSKFGHFVSLVEENFRLLQSTAIVNYCPLIRLLPGDPFSSKKVIFEDMIVCKACLFDLVIIGVRQSITEHPDASVTMCENVDALPTVDVLYKCRCSIYYLSIYVTPLLSVALNRSSRMSQTSCTTSWSPRSRKSRAALMLTTTTS